MHDGTDPRGGFPFPHNAAVELYIGKGLTTAVTGGTRVLRHALAQNTVAQTPPDTIDFADAVPTDDFDSIQLVLSTGPTNVHVRGYLWNLAVQVDGQRYVLDLADRFLDATVSSRAEPSDIPAAPDLSNLDVAVSTRAAPSDIPDVPTPTVIADAVWTKALADYTSQADHDGDIAYELNQMRLTLNTARDRLPNDLAARLNTLRDRLPASVADDVALARRVAMADMSIADGVLTLRDDDGVIATFNARQSADPGNFSGGRTRQ